MQNIFPSAVPAQSLSTNRVQPAPPAPPAHLFHQISLGDRQWQMYTYILPIVPNRRSVVVQGVDRLMEVIRFLHGFRRHTRHPYNPGLLMSRLTLSI